MSELFTNQVNCGVQPVEGVPVGVKLLGIRRPKLHEHVMPSDGHITRVSCPGDWRGIYPIVAIDNVYGVFDLKEVPIFPGWERDAEDWFRYPLLRRNDSYVVPETHSIGRTSLDFNLTGDTRRIIVHRKSAGRGAAGPPNCEVCFDIACDDCPACGGSHNRKGIRSDNAGISAGLPANPVKQTRRVLVGEWLVDENGLVVTQIASFKQPATSIVEQMPNNYRIEDREI